MSRLNEYLKEEREKKGITLDEASAKTRIAKKILLAIEEGNFNIQSPVFMRGFIRSYASFLGLDPASVMSMFEADSLLSIQQDKLIAEQASKDAPVKKTGYVIAGIIFLTVVILFSLYRSVQKEMEEAPATVEELRVPKKQDAVMINVSTFSVMTSIKIEGLKALTTVVRKPLPEENTLKDDTETPPAQSAEKGHLEKKPEVVINPSPEKKTVKPDSVKVNKAEKKYNLVIYAREMTWLRISVDNSLSREVLLRPGEKASWSGDKNITIVSGNAGGVDLTLNGAPLEPLGASGKIVTRVIP